MTKLSGAGALRLAPIVLAGVLGSAAAPALAGGTQAGTKIDNQATATYDGPGGGTVSVPSNLVSLTVDEILDVTVVSADPGDVQANAGAADRVLTFTVTNTGNGQEAFGLAALGTLGGDDFDPTVTSIVLDSNGNGAYDAGVDTVYVAGGNDPVLAPDARITVFVLSTMPAGADGARGRAQLGAVAKTGTGAPGFTFAGQGQGGGDAVVGTTGADADANGVYRLSAAAVSFVKSQTVLDPFGGSQAVPGAVITYSLVATVSGGGTLNNLRVGDPIPAGTTYQPGTLTLQGAALTDATDGDAGEFASGAIATRLGNVSGGQTRTVTFQVKVN